MFGLPPGYDDMLGDAEDAPSSDRYRNLQVDDDVGAVSARKPMPNAVALLAKAKAAKFDARTRNDHLVLFVKTHLADGEFERLLLGMLEETYPDDTMERVARAVATWGTARPYAAVLGLAVMTAHHWRTIRLKFVLAGIADPMALPTMHILLDVMEKTVLESMVTGKATEDEAERRRFLDSLYSPTGENAAINGATVASGQPPPGFEPDAVEASFAAFAAVAR